MHQEALDVGRLVNWTKSFNCSGVIGEDVVKMLNAALRKQGVDVDVVAVLNDTTGSSLLPYMYTWRFHLAG
jgi:hexokinase